jgi:DNA-binding PadR family transcriptional regulator
VSKVLELAVLGLLKEQQLHGYELKKRLSDTLGGGSTNGVSFGSLYPALSRLEAAGAVKTVEERGEPGGIPFPMTGSFGGELAAFRARFPSRLPSRGRKVYAITELGEQLFADLLAGETFSGDEDRSFNLRLAMARYLEPDARVGLLSRRRGVLVERLARSRARLRAGSGRLDSYRVSLIEHASEMAESDIAWIDRLIAQEGLDRPIAQERLDHSVDGHLSQPHEAAQAHEISQLQEGSQFLR